MTVISYRQYALDLEERIRKLRCSEDVNGTIEVVIFRNAFCFRSFEVIGNKHRRDYHMGPFNAELAIGNDQKICQEIDDFFLLPEVYAYSDLALRAERNPLKRSHWDGTLALIDVKYSTAVTTWHQRMLFIAFGDLVHADFAVALDKDIFKDGVSGGTQFFEWRPAHIAQIEDSSADVQNAKSIYPASAGPRKALPPECLQCLAASDGGASMTCPRLRGVNEQLTLAQE